MSDGPHRTLPMRTQWKRLAERAAKDVHSMEEVEEAVCPALLSDWNADVRVGFFNEIGRVFMDDPQGSLFQDHQILDLDRLRSSAGSPLEALLVDCALDSLANGLNGRDALTDSLRATLTERAHRGKLQVEEHYRREGSSRGASNVFNRLERAIPSAPISALSNSIVERSVRSGDFKLSAKNGVEDGVNLV